MAERRKIIFDWIGNPGSFLRSNKAVQRGAQATEKGFAGIATAAKGAFALFAGQQVVSRAGELRALANSADEAASKFNSVFGPAADNARVSTEKWAEAAGVANHVAQDVTATFGNLAQSQGIVGEELLTLTRNVQGLAGDLASFNNANPEDVLNDLNKALLTTEREGLKKFGIAITEAEVKARAQAKATQEGRTEVTKADRAYASYTIAVEQAGAAVGDLARTQESGANKDRRRAAQIENLRVGFAKRLNPAMDATLDALDDLASGFVALGDIMGDVDRDTEAYAATTEDMATRILRQATSGLSAFAEMSRWVSEQIGEADRATQDFGETMGHQIRQAELYAESQRNIAAALNDTEDSAISAREALQRVSDFLKDPDNYPDAIVRIAVTGGSITGTGNERTDAPRYGDTNDIEAERRFLRRLYGTEPETIGGN